MVGRPDNADVGGLDEGVCSMGTFPSHHFTASVPFYKFEPIFFKPLTGEYGLVAK